MYKAECGMLKAERQKREREREKKYGWLLVTAMFKTKAVTF